MADPFLKKKWERFFYTFLDTNRNRIIEWNDFEVLFEKVKELRGENSNEYRIISDAMVMVWTGLLQAAKSLKASDHVDKYDTISVEDWDKMWKDFDPNRMPVWQREYLKYMFFLIDTSGDKFIDVDEYTEVMKIYGISESDARKAFEKFAVDEKGQHQEKVDYGLFVKLWSDYFHSPDKNKPGSYLFGIW